MGEPIIYPEINTFLSHMHSKGISSFMVTNAQFPDRIEQLVPVTQLYVSIDAPTEGSLLLPLLIFSAFFYLALDFLLTHLVSHASPPSLPTSWHPSKTKTL